MAKTRVHELAKEFGMSSKEMLERLQDMKIPAKNHASTLEDAYVNKVRKALAPELEARAAEIEASRKAEEEAQREAERLAKEQAERERIEAEKREAARREEQKRREQELEAKRAREAEEKRLKEEAEEREREKNRVKDNAPKAHTNDLSALLKQIKGEQARLEQKQEQEKAVKESDNKSRSSRSGNQKNASQRSDDTAKDQKASRNGGKQADQDRGSQEVTYTNKIEVPAELKGRVAQAQRTASDADPDARDLKRAKKGRRNRDGEGDDGNDRYKRMAEQAERFQKSKVLSDARHAVDEARQEENAGRRKKRKEKREREAEERRREEAIEQAKAAGLAPEDYDVVQISEGSTVQEVAEALEVNANDIIKRLFLLGTPLTLAQSMSNDLIELIADDLERRVHIKTAEEENSFNFYDAPEDLKGRPPVVTVMGHVDHGKTSLLDAIRNTGVAEGEAGGITQHIGASVVNINNRQITFVDTPGHEAFTAMRARGAKVTDIVILVVAADDGVMPQTIEAINHSKAAGVPIVVAVNKVDKPEANPDRVRQELVEHGVIPEEWGGENMFVNVSAKKRIGIDDLLETVLLQADVLELKANPDTFASGYVLEGKLDKGRGPVATILVSRGTLKVGDSIVAGTSYGRVRALLDPRGNTIDDLKPSDPAEVLGLNSVPLAGDEFRVFEDERDARNLAEERALKQRLVEQDRKQHVTLENLFEQMGQAELKELNLVVKADVQGSIEALKDALDKMDQSEVRINVIHAAVGGITETDVVLAAASNAIIIGFGVRPQPKARAAAEHESVQIRTYRVIYSAIEDINAARVGMLNPDIVEVDTGTAEVRETFKVPKVGTIAGCYVVDGEINREDNVRVVRDGTVIFEGTLASLRRFKDDVKSVKNGYECGIGVNGFQDIKVGDLIEGYKITEVARKE